MNATSVNPPRQAGAALLVFTALLVLISASVLLDRLSSRAQLNTDRELETTAALAEAKAALIAWSVSHSREPGRLPWPDRNTDPSGSNYDGKADCSTVGVSNELLLGRFPYVGDVVPCSVEELGIYPLDGAGEPLFYAVSQNLIQHRGKPDPADPPINPGLLDGSAAYPWLSVRDQSGAPLVDSSGQPLKIAAVIIAPGDALPGQIRCSLGSDGKCENGNPPPDPDQYLDSVAGIESNTDNDLVFIQYPDSRFTAVETDSFNDRLVYITIDELMPKIEKRVIGEAAVSLLAYHDAATPPDNPAFPWLRPYTDPRTATNFDSQAGTREGLLPVHQANASFSTGFTVEWSGITNADIVLDPPGGSVTEGDLTDGPAGGVEVPESPDNCTWTNPDGRRTVYCSGTVIAFDPTSDCVDDVGPPPRRICTRRTWIFNLYHMAASNPTISAPRAAEVRRRAVSHTGSLPGHPDGLAMIELIEEEEVTVIPSGVIISPWSETGRGTLTTRSDTTGDVSTSGIRYDLDYETGEIPQWLVENNWHRYLYGVISADHVPDGGAECWVTGNCLEVNVVGTTPRNDVQALITSPGGQLECQNRTTGMPPPPPPPCPPGQPDYLDDYFENNNAVTANDSADRGVLSATFNDQVRVIQPNPP